MLRKLLLIIISLSPFSSVFAQKIAEFKVQDVTGALPLSISLDDITLLPESELTLVEIVNNKSVSVPYQIENKGRRVLYWIPERNKTPTSRTFELRREDAVEYYSKVKVTDNNGALIINFNNKNLLQYNYKTHYPPVGVDTAFKRSGFIHPLWTPKGQALTRIDAPDHYHHYGLWNPWTKVLFEGEVLDFWNIKDNKGTVRFADLVSVNEGAVYGDYQTLHKHVAFKSNG